MLRPRWQKVVTDLWKNKSRSMLVVASIMVGLFAIGIIANLYLTINRDMQVGFQSIHPANVMARTALIDDDMVDWIEHLPEIRRVEPVRRFSMQVENKTGAWDAIDVQGKDYSEAQINLVGVLQGTWPPQEGQIVLSNHKLENLSVRLGDEVRLRDAQGKLYSLQLVGVIQDQSIGMTGGSGGFFGAAIQGYVDPAQLDHLGLDQPEKYNELQMMINGDALDPAVRLQAEKSVRAALEDNNITINNLSSRDPRYHTNKELVDAIIGILLLLGLLIVFLSAFLITNTLQSILDQQIQQVGILKSIGARRTQITVIYMALIFLFGLLAFAAAYPLAWLVSDWLIRFLAGKVNFTTQGIAFEPLVLAIQIILALLVPQIAAILPILQGTRISVQEALSGIRQSTETGRGWIDRLLAHIRWLSRPLSIALRNVFRRKGRLALTLVTLTLGGAVFISVFNVRVSLSNYVAQISQYFLADLNLTLARPYRSDHIQEALSAVPEIAKVEAWGAARGWIVEPDGSLGDSVNLSAVPRDSHLIRPILLEGRWLLPDDQNAIVLNDQFMTQFPDVHVGDTLTLKIGSQQSEWVVVGYFQLAGKIGGLLAYVNLDYLTTQPGVVPGQASNFRIVADRPLSSAEQKDLQKQVQGVLDANNIQISDLTTGAKLNESTAASFAVLTNFLLFLAVLTALVGSIGLTGTMSMNVMDRTREIGVMRSIGAADPILMQMVLVEGLLIGWISWFLGALVSFPISQLMSDMVTQALFGASSPMGVTPTGFVLWFIVVSVLAVLASLLPARSAARLTIREVLAYE
jgi:putative ABC transport system permease protein